MSDDTFMVLCATVQSLPQAQTDPGSEMRWCMICGEPVWCSVTTLAEAERNPRLQILCNPCGVPLVEAEPEKRIAQTPGDQRSRREVQQVWRELKRRHGRRDV